MERYQRLSPLIRDGQFYSSILALQLCEFLGQISAISTLSQISQSSKKSSCFLGGHLDFHLFFAYHLNTNELETETSHAINSDPHLHPRSRQRREVQRHRIA
jgi:hypothetical protein